MYCTPYEYIIVSKEKGHMFYPTLLVLNNNMGIHIELTNKTKSIFPSSVC